MPFEFFKHADASLLREEGFEAYASKTPAVWPSECSAALTDQRESLYVGKCHRAALWRMIGTPQTNPIDAVGALRFRLGRLIEGTMADLAKAAGILAATGIKHYIPDLGMSIEMDNALVDPVTFQGVIGECKSYYGYVSKKRIENENQPKMDNVLQLLMYLAEFKTGKRLKAAIAGSQKVREQDDLRGKKHRNKIEVFQGVVDSMNDGPLGAKLLYIARDSGARPEFNISFGKGFDDYHYPIVNNEMKDWFTLESAYQRYGILQDYWFKMRRKAYENLAFKKILPPEHVLMIFSRADVAAQAEANKDGYAPKSPAQWDSENRYFAQLEDEVRKLPDSFLPPAEYEWLYSDEKVEMLGELKILGKTKYEEYKTWKAGRRRKPGQPFNGDWHCRYCPFRNKCIPKTNPEKAYLLADLEITEEETA